MPSLYVATTALTKVPQNNYNDNENNNADQTATAISSSITTSGRRNRTPSRRMLENMAAEEELRKASEEETPPPPPPQLKQEDDNPTPPQIQSAASSSSPPATTTTVAAPAPQSKPSPQDDTSRDLLSNAHCCVCHSGDVCEGNDVLMCDGPGCHRAYHQLCHFVPVFVIPRGNWYCLICTYSQNGSLITNTPKKAGRGRPRKSSPVPFLPPNLPPPKPIPNLQSIYPPYTPSSPTPFNPTLEQTLETTYLAPLKPPHLTHSLKTLRSTLTSSLSQIRSASDTIRIYTSSTRAQRHLQTHGPSAELTNAQHKLSLAKRKIRMHLLELKSFIASHRRNEPRVDNEEDDDDVAAAAAGIPSHKIACCICFSAESTDENDILLCDGRKCFRGFHAKCVCPAIRKEELSETDPWFCPYCDAYGNLIHYVQKEYFGDEVCEKDWFEAEDVFGDEEEEEVVGGEGVGGGVGVESEEEDEDFDPEDKEEGRDENEGDEEDDDESEASLDDLSSVEVKIDKSELDALSGAEDNDDEEEGANRKRRTRNVAPTPDKPDTGKLDEENIVMGKRQRAHVDYRKLNDTLFGASLAPHEIDEDDDEFVHDHEHDHDDSNVESNDDDDDDQESAYGDADQPKTKRPNKETPKRKRGRPKKQPLSESDGTPIVKKRGRPKKNPDATGTPVVKRKRGRPRKSPLPDGDDGTPKAKTEKRGRPRKNPLPEADNSNASAEKTDRQQTDGTKVELDGTTPPAKRKRGRPRKSPLPEDTDGKQQPAVTDGGKTGVDDLPATKEPNAESKTVGNEIPSTKEATSEKQMVKSKTQPESTNDKESSKAVATDQPKSDHPASETLPKTPNAEIPATQTPTPKKRGRPRKSPLPAVTTNGEKTPGAKRKRGRPRKNSGVDGMAVDSTVDANKDSATGGDGGGGTVTLEEVEASSESLPKESLAVPATEE